MDFATVDETAQGELLWTDSLDGAADPFGVRDLYKLSIPGQLHSQSGETDVVWTLVPFYARCNRAKGAMRVFLPVVPLAHELHQFAVPSASYTYPGDSPLHLNDGSDSPAKRWTSYNYGNILQDPWVQYDFDSPVEVNGCCIWWYDDQGGVQLPDGFEIYYKSDPADFFAPVQHDGAYSCDRADTFQTYTFAPVSVTSLRLIFHVSKASAGIVEWKLLQPENTPPDEPAQPDVSEITRPADDPASHPAQTADLCPWDSIDHGTSFGGRFVRFFHNIFYFFAHLFGLK